MGTVVTATNYVRPVAMKQEQEPASEQITEVAPGILRLQLPIQFTGLGHVNCYALEDDNGFTLVDPGLPGPEPWKGLLDRLGRADVPLARVHSVVVTHSHPDHFGGAAQLRDETGADIVTHRSFRLWWEPGRADLDDTPSDALDAPDDWAHTTPWGSEFLPPTGGTMTEMRTALKSNSHTPRPTRRLDDAEVVRLGGRDWVALHTPGHTADHLCLYDPADGVLLSGDHVLPSITPHIGGTEGSGDDPLADFFNSLERMRTLVNVTVALPAHGHPFHDLTKRVGEIETHHAERLDRLRSASAELDRPASVHELMQLLFSERAWGSMAESETYAHLEHLRLRGDATSEWIDGLLYYAVHEQR